MVSEVSKSSKKRDFRILGSRIHISAVRVRSVLELFEDPGPSIEKGATQMARNLTSPGIELGRALECLAEFNARTGEMNRSKEFHRSSSNCPPDHVLANLRNFNEGEYPAAPPHQAR